MRRDRTDRIDCQRSPSVDAPSPWAFLYAFVESSAAGGAGYVDRSADYRSRGCIGIIVAGKAIITARAISRRPSHHLATHTGASPVPPAVDLRPPE